MRTLVLSILTLTALSFTACDIDKTSSGELPDIDVDVDAGELPTYDVDWVDVDVRTTTKTVEVPKVRIVMEEEEIEVPVVDLDWPEDYGDKEEMTLMVEADVNQDAALEIEEVYTNGNRIIVLASLDKDGEMLEDGEMMRVSDQIVINAPDVDVRYYIIGDRPDGMTNTRYRYITSKNDIAKIRTNGQAIYTRN